MADSSGELDAKLIEALQWFARNSFLPHSTAVESLEIVREWLQAEIAEALRRAVMSGDLPLPRR